MTLWPWTVLHLLIAGDLAQSAPVKSVCSRTDDGYNLVFEDEFEGDKLNTSTWSTLDQAYPYNKELEYYLTSNVVVKDGALVIRSNKEKHGGRDYTSGRVNTTGKRTWQYGRFCVRAKLPGQNGTGQGLWPAHWLLPDMPCWPDYGELDIMEMVDGDGVMHASMHWNPKYPEMNCTYKAATCSGMNWPKSKIPDFEDEWHEYAMEWEPDHVTFFLDGTPMSFPHPKHGGGNGTCSAKGNGTYNLHEQVPKTPMYFILNTAIGGKWPKAPNASTKWPAYHYVDYVRVAQKTPSQVEWV